MKAKFVITNISPYFKSDKDDSSRLTPTMKDLYSGINCTITFKKVIDPKNKIIEETPVFMHHGNTNPQGVKPFEHLVNGVMEIEGADGKKKSIMDSDKIMNGTVLDVVYATKLVGSKTHIIPVSVKVCDFINLDKVKKTADKIHTLDF